MNWLGAPPPASDKLPAVPKSPEALRSPVDSVPTPISRDPYLISSPMAGELAVELAGDGADADFHDPDLKVEITDAAIGASLLDRAEQQQAEEDRRKREGGAGAASLSRTAFRKARSVADASGKLGLKSAISKSSRQAPLG